ncbi:MAG: SCO family protein [Acidobacteriota bacterium]|nr:MAG: SCO family protein [Acidobacteriota bacterium]
MRYRTRVYTALVLLISAVSMFAQNEQPSAAEQYFTNTELVDQNGTPHKFFSGLLKGKTVVISSFHTSCTSTVPVYNRTLGKIQEEFKDRMGSELLIISITLDPENDTSGKLKEYAAKFNAGPGWLFLTGSKADVEFMLRKLGYYVEDIEAHNSVITVGNGKTSLWKKVNGLANAGDVIEAVRGVLDDKGN